MAFDLGDADGRRVDVDLNQLVPYDGESVVAALSTNSSASVNRNVEPSRSDAPPPPPPQPLEPAPAPPHRQGHGQRGRRLNSLDLDPPAPPERGVSDPNQPCPPSGHQEPQHEVPNEVSHNGMGHTPQSRLALLQPSGSGAPPSSPPPVPTSAVPSSSSVKLNTTAGNYSSNGFKAVKAFLKDARGFTIFTIQFICSCGCKSKQTMKVNTNRGLKDEREVKCRCKKFYIIKLEHDKFSLSCYARKKEKNEICSVTGSLPN